MAKSAREPMHNVDKAWLEMDAPTNRMVINGLMLFDGQLEFARVVKVLEERLVARFERFRQRVIDTRGPGMAWEEDPYFDLRSHVRHIALPAPGTIDTLQQLLSDLASESLEPHKPLWRFYVIENVDGGSALFGRIHHCLADGVALVQVLLSLTDTSALGEPEPRWPTEEPAPRRTSRGLLGSLRAGVRKGVKLAFDGAELLYHEAAATFNDPSRLGDGLYRAGLISLTGAAIVSKLLLIPPDNDSVFKGNLSALKRVVWSDPIDLAEVKALGRSAGATINDVLVAAVAGALRRYMLEQGGAVDIRTMIPVNLRDLSKPITEMGNQFALVYLTMPLESEHALERLRAVKQQMDVLKQSPEPLIVYEILSILGMAPGELADIATTWFSSKASSVLTNVPGPREPIFFTGLPIKRVLFWVPQTGRIGLGISIISYNGAVTLGVMADEALVRSPEHILRFFHEELDALRAEVARTTPGHEPIGKGAHAAEPTADLLDPVAAVASFVETPLVAIHVPELEDDEAGGGPEGDPPAADGSPIAAAGLAGAAQGHEATLQEELEAALEAESALRPLAAAEHVEDEPLDAPAAGLEGMLPLPDAGESLYKNGRPPEAPQSGLDRS
jgi:WS/DGAT/MGAT family acyltransferase